MVGRLMSKGSMVCVLLFAATVALWVRSYLVHEAVDFGTWNGRAGVVSCKGRIAFGVLRVNPSVGVWVPRGFIYRADPADVGASTDLKPGWSSWTGLQAARMQLPGVVATDVRVPYAYLALLIGGVGALLMYRRYRTTRPGLCRVCSYNLANNVSGVCPECAV